MQEIKLKLANGLNLAGITWGDETNPPLLALHGWLDNAASFTPMANLLSKKYYVVALDLPGHGLSDHLPASCHYHFIDTVNIGLQATQALGWKTFSLLGHSMGAGIASLMAGTFPKKIAQLMLIEGLGPLTDECHNAAKRLETYLRYQQRSSLVRGYSSLQQAIDKRVKNNDLSLPAATLLVKRAIIEQQGQFIWRHDQRLLFPSATRLSEAQVHSFLQRITAPSLLILGSGGLAFPETLLKQRMQCIPTLTTHTLEGNHHLHMENPKVGEYCIR